jgi:hypothetical protein
MSIWSNFFCSIKFLLGVVYDIDVQEGMAYISGKVDPHKILKKLVKSGKHAKLCWVEIGNQYTYYQDDMHPPSRGGRDPYWDDYSRDSYLNSYRSRTPYWDNGYRPGYNSYYQYQPPMTNNYYQPHAPYNPYYY